MSYKKFNDLQNLYEGVVSESNEIDEYTELVYNIIIAEMVHRGHSESVIRTYVENISEEQILEKVESFFSLEEFNLNEGQTDLLFSFYQEQQLIVERINSKTASDILKGIRGSSSKLKNMIMSLIGKGKKSGHFMDGAKTGIDLNNLKGAKDGPGLLKRLQNLKKSAGNQLNKVKNQLNKVKSTFDKKVTKTSDTLLGPDGKPLKTTKTVNPINKKNAAIAGGLGVVGATAALTGGDNKDKEDINKENQLQDVLNNKDKLQKLEPPKVEPDKGQKGEGDKGQKVEPPKPTNPSGKELPKPRAIGKGKGEINPNSARGQMIARNKEIFGTDAAGNDRVDKLRNKNAAFQAAKKSGSNYSMKDFVKDFPDSNTAKDARKSKRVTSVMDMESYDAYDLVLNYIIETEQASTIEEANYIMVEMDQNTIYSIIKENTINRADIIGGTKAAKNAQQGIGKYKPGVGVTKDFQLVPNFRIKA